MIIIDRYYEIVTGTGIDLKLIKICPNHFEN